MAKKKLTANQIKKREQKRLRRVARKEEDTAAGKPAKRKLFPLGGIHQKPDLKAILDEMQPYWDSFVERDLDGRLAYIEDELEGTTFDRDYAVSMLGLIRDTWESAEHRQRFLTLTNRIEKERPDIYRGMVTSFLSWKIEDGLALGHRDVVAGAARAFLEHVEDVELFSLILDQLTFAGELDLVLECRRRAWGGVKKSEGSEDGGAQFLEDSINLEVLSFVVENPDPASDFAGLLERLVSYDKGFRMEMLDERKPFFYGETGEVSAADLAKPPTRQKGQSVESVRTERACRLVNLTFLFVHEMTVAKLLPPSRAELGRWGLFAAILEDLDGDLAPDPRALEKFLMSYYGILYPRPSRTVAFLELFPHWLRFLADHDIISSATYKERLLALESLVERFKMQVGGLSLPMLEESLAALSGRREEE